MKKIYLVRHGQGEHNLKKLFTTPNFNLTDKGKKQAEILARRLSNFPIEIILSSPYIADKPRLTTSLQSGYKRTVQTSEIINQKLKKEIVYTPLLEEIKRPSEIAGKSWTDPKVLEIWQEVSQNFNRKKWHFSDEENFYDFQKRIWEFLVYLEKFEQSHILLVTHINVIYMIVLTMMFDVRLTSDIFRRGYDFLNLDTSGLTICQKSEKETNTTGLKRKTPWELITWNDISHLGDAS